MPKPKLSMARRAEPDYLLPQLRFQRYVEFGIGLAWGTLLWLIVVCLMLAIKEKSFTVVLFAISLVFGTMTGVILFFGVAAHLAAKLTRWWLATPDIAWNTAMAEAFRQEYPLWDDHMASLTPERWKWLQEGLEDYRRQFMPMKPEFPYTLQTDARDMVLRLKDWGAGLQLHIAYRDWEMARNHAELDAERIPPE